MSTPNPQADADAFNAKIAVGDWIRYNEVKGEGMGTLYQTKTTARVLQGHTAVVWLEGKAGCVCCDHCEAVPANEMAAMLKTEEPPPTGPPTHLLVNVMVSRRGEPLAAFWQEYAAGYTTSLAQAAIFPRAFALKVERQTDDTVAIPLTDIGHRLSTDGDRVPFTGMNAALLTTMLEASNRFPSGEETQAAEPPAETAEAKTARVEATAKALEHANNEWRKASGYTGTPVHRPAYWWALASHLIANPPTP